MFSKSLIALLVFCALAPFVAAQDQSVAVRVKYGLIEKIWSILLRPKTTIVNFTCDKTELEPGEIAACTVTINVPARAGGLRIEVLMPAELTGPAIVTIPQSATSATFTISRPNTAAGVRRLYTSGYRVTAWYSERARYYAVVM